MTTSLEQTGHAGCKAYAARIAATGTTAQTTRLCAAWHRVESSRLASRKEKEAARRHQSLADFLKAVADHIEDRPSVEVSA